VPPLRFGTLMHKALAAYYKPGIRRGPHPTLTFQKEYELECERAETFGFRVDDDEVWVEAGTLGEDMLNAYVDHYGKDTEWEVLLTEQRFAVPIAHPETGKPWFLYKGTLDGVWRSRRTKKIWIPDHKTTRSIDPKYLALDEQAGAYWTFGVQWLYEQKVLRRGQKLAGMLFNFLRKAMQDDRPQNAEGHYLNKDGSVSKVQPSPFFARVPIFRDTHDREAVRERVLQEYAELEETRAGERPAYKNPWSGNCKGCWLFDICELHETGNDWLSMRSATTMTWEPHSEEEIYVSERG
jgi:hypothetical protein